MAGFNLPLQAIPPQLLAEMARAAFKPPALMSVGGLGGGGGGMGALPQSPGFNVGQGASNAALALGGLGAQLFKGPGIDERTRASDAEIADWSKYGSQGQMPSPSIDAEIANWSNYGGGRADGGEVMPGKHYTVGEQGPETFVPAVPGYIVPNDPYLGLPGRLPPDDQYYGLPGRIPPNDQYYSLPGRVPPNDPYPILPGRLPPLDFFGGRVRR